MKIEGFDSKEDGELNTGYWLVRIPLRDRMKGLLARRTVDTAAKRVLIVIFRGCHAERRVSEEELKPLKLPELPG